MQPRRLTMRKILLCLGLLACLSPVSKAIFFNPNFTEGTIGNALGSHQHISASSDWVYAGTPAFGGELPSTPLDGIGIAPASGNFGYFEFDRPMVSFLVLSAFLDVGTLEAFNDGWFAIRVYDSLGNLIDNSVHEGPDGIASHNWITASGKHEVKFGTIAELPFTRVEIESTVPFVIDNIFYGYEGQAVETPDGGATALLLALGCFGLMALRRH